jgi:hypothetical protein
MKEVSKQAHKGAHITHSGCVYSQAQLLNSERISYGSEDCAVVSEEARWKREGETVPLECPICLMLVTRFCPDAEVLRPHQHRDMSIQNEAIHS